MAIVDPPRPHVDRFVVKGRENSCGRVEPFHRSYGVSFDSITNRGEFVANHYLDAIAKHRQVVFYGPPGTGKTFVARTPGLGPQWQRRLLSQLSEFEEVQTSIGDLSWVARWEPLPMERHYESVVRLGHLLLTSTSLRSELGAHQVVAQDPISLGRDSSTPDGLVTRSHTQFRSATAA